MAMKDYLAISPSGVYDGAPSTRKPMPMRMNYIGLNQAKMLKSWGTIKEPSDVAKTSPNAFTPIPMYLPTRTDGKTVAKVVTRQSFIDTNIEDWVMYRTEKIFAIACGIAAVFAITISPFISAGLALLAGWFYGQHIWKGFKLNNLLRNRMLLEST